MGLDYNTAKQRSSLELIVQINAVFIMFYDAHGPKNIIEGVMVEDPPILFSPFSLADCTMLNHFSFNDFIAVAFPDLAGDLDIQI